MFFLITPIESFSQDKPHKSAKRAKIETISKKRAKSKIPPRKKSAQKRSQKARIENNSHVKTNKMWK
jgi:hypothetical protein